MKNKTIIAVLIIFGVLTLNFASAVVVDLSAPVTISPGLEVIISMEIDNTLNDDINDVSLVLNFQNLPFIPIGTSEESVDEIKEDDEEDFSFKIKASNGAVPGDYAVPYTLTYEVNGDVKTRTGTIGVKVKANPDLTFSLSAENPVLNKKGQISLRIVNKGLSDARFVSVKALPLGLTLLSEEEVYIGTVDSDDFETAVFDVIFTSQNPNFRVIVEYKDFDNELKTNNLDLPVKVYSEDKAIELGIIQKNNLGIYVLVVILIILLWILWRFFKKRSRMKKSMNGR